MTVRPAAKIVAAHGAKNEQHEICRLHNRTASKSPVTTCRHAVGRTSMLLLARPKTIETCLLAKRVMAAASVAAPAGHPRPPGRCARPNPRRCSAADRRARCTRRKTDASLNLRLVDPFRAPNRIAPLTSRRRRAAGCLCTFRTQPDRRPSRDADHRCAVDRADASATKRPVLDRTSQSSFGKTKSCRTD